MPRRLGYLKVTLEIRAKKVHLLDATSNRARRPATLDCSCGRGKHDRGKRKHSLLLELRLDDPSP